MKVNFESKLSKSAHYDETKKIALTLNLFK